MTAQAQRQILRVRFALLTAALVFLAASPASVHSASATYEYDVKGRVSKITYDDGTVVDYTYNLKGSRTGATKTTPPPDTTPPSAPGAPIFSNITMTSATASWTAATDNKGVVGYDYKVNAGAWQSLNNVLSVNLTGLTAATSYSVQVRARDAATNIGPVSSNSFSTPDTQAPTVPTGLGGSAPNSSTVNLSWNASTDNVAVTGYRVYRDGGQIGTSATTSYSDGGRTGSTTYSYQVAAYDAATNVSGLSSSINVTTPDTIAPTTPTSLSVSAVSPSRIDLFWVASSDSGGSGLAGYRVYRGGSHIANTSSSSYSDTGLAGSTTYSYNVAAYDGASNVSGQSNAASATTLPTLTALASNTNWRWRRSANNVTTIDPPVVVTASGGTGTGYTYSWQYSSGDTQISVIHGSSNSTGWTRSMPNQTITFTGTWKCVVTDSGGNTTQVFVNVTFIRITAQ